MADETARVLVRMPESMRRKLKIVAAMEECSLNEQIIAYIKQGLSSTKAQILSQGLIDIEE